MKQILPLYLTLNSEVRLDSNEILNYCYENIENNIVAAQAYSIIYNQDSFDNNDNNENDAHDP